MSPYNYSDSLPNGWLAFELSVLRRLKFKSVAMPFTGEPDLGFYLKRWNVRVAANDLARWSSTKAAASIENNAERLGEDEIEAILEDAYVPRQSLHNESLLKWFNETDAWWFDNLRENADGLNSGLKRAQALSLGMMVGDYVLSFDAETRSLRQPLALSDVYRRLWQIQPSPVNNSQRNTSDNREAREFIAEQHTDLLFLRLPRARQPRERNAHTFKAWREEWIRGGDDFWDGLEGARAGRLGAHIETKQQYLRLVEDFLHTAAHVPKWAIAHIEDGFVSTNELTDCVGSLRKVETVYTKDFSELTGARATIIAA